jgi:hypothetical protein
MGPKHGKGNKKSGPPFNCDTFFWYMKREVGSILYTKYHSEIMKPSDGFEPNMVEYYHGKWFQSHFSK